MLCTATVWDNFRSHPCDNKAKYEGYCGVHSPEKIAERKKKRGPSLYERACHLLDLEREEEKRKDALILTLAGVLRAGQWGTEQYCTSCGGHEDYGGHDEDCELTLALALVEDPDETR